MTTVSATGPSQGSGRPDPDPCLMIIFGASGDLTGRKLVPALYSLSAEGALPKPFGVVGYARSERTDDRFRENLREKVDRFARRKPVDESVWQPFADHLYYVQGGYDDLESFHLLGKRLQALEAELGTGGNRLFYLATPPSVYGTILHNLQDAGLLHHPDSDQWSRVIIEKPFGHDLESAQVLNRTVSDVLDESQTYRIDHYLGKETVQNILVFRFGNAIFEPIWNRNHIDHVQITAAESIGIGSRAGFYDQTGVLRDFVQNHLLEVLTLVTMEQPVHFEADFIRDEKHKVLQSLRPITEHDVPEEVVRARYDGYLGEEGVAPDSRTPTYVGIRAHIDNWRWQGVPFYIRAGKALAERVTEVAIHFRSIPFCLFGRDELCQRLDNNVLRIRIQPDEGINLQFVSKVPGDELAVSNVVMDMKYATTFHREPLDAYERLILDGILGDAMRFARRDFVEQAWAWCTPILRAWEADGQSPVPEYAKGSQGPEEADALLRAGGHRWLPIA